MLGLALEGGGARAAFHFGAYKALYDLGYRFDGIVGTSIGAINGAVIAQGDYEQGLEFWNKIDSSDLFDISRSLPRIENGINKDTLKLVSEQFKTFIGNTKGLDTSKIRKLLNTLIDEDKLRLSSVDFGIVTVSLSDLKPLELFKEDIPEGKIVEYIMASANLPAFKLEPLDGKYYLDGGFWDNCPSNMLLSRGYDEIIEIRTNSLGVTRKLKKKDIKLTTIMPSESLGGILEFKSDRAKHNFTLGYLDAMRVLRSLKGKYYYLTPSHEPDRYFELFCSLPEALKLSCAKLLKLDTNGDSNRIFFEKVIPEMSKLLSLPPSASYEDIFIAMCECMGQIREIDRYSEKTVSQLVSQIKKRRIKRSGPLPTAKKLAVSSLGSVILKYDKIYDFLR